jgi:hypothetical protein
MLRAGPATRWALSAVLRYPFAERLGQVAQPFLLLLRPRLLRARH